MVHDRLQVRMLGDFSISTGDAVISSGSDRSRKLWLLIAYLICRRGTWASPEELIALLWGGSPRGTNPANSLKTLCHRARTLLNRLGGGMGYDLLLRQENGYAWNTGIPVEVDTERFLRLCRTAGETDGEEERLACLLEAAGLYRGDFLEKLSSELWVLPLASGYHRLYVECVQTAMGLLEARSRWGEEAALCRAALKQEPCSESFCQGLMAALIQMGDRQGAVEVYTEVRERLMTELGIVPSDALRDLYQTALRSTAPQALSAGALLSQLQESPSAGALICDYDFFRTIYHAHVRMSERNGDAAHLVLVSVVSGDGELSSRSLDRIMDHLQEILRLCLRRGDIAARCSASQFAVLLPQANYENSRMVCQRVGKAFSRQYPHAPARLSMDIQPLAPAPAGTEAHV